MTVLVVAEAVVILLLAILVVGMLRSHAEILRKLHDLGEGEAASAAAPFQTAEGVAAPRASVPDVHDIAGTAPNGGAVAIRVTQPGTVTLLAFMSTFCPTCESFWPRFADPATLQQLDPIRLVIVTKGQEDERPAAIAEVAPPGVTVVMSSAAWEAYAVPGSPYFVMVDGTHRAVTGEGTAGSWEKLLDLMGIADGDTPVADGVPTDRERTERVDQELADAGILPGDPQLYPDPEANRDSAS